MWKRILLSTAVVAALAPAAMAQNRDNPPPRDPPPRSGGTTTVEKRTTATTEVRRGTMIIGTRLSITGDAVGGTIEDIVLSSDGCVEYVVVNHDGKLRVVPWTVVRFSGDRVATVQITQEKWREVPTFAATQYPTFDAQYRTKIYGYYDVKGDRRDERRDNRDDRRDDRRENRDDRRDDRRDNPPNNPAPPR